MLHNFDLPPQMSRHGLNTNKEIIHAPTTPFNPGPVTGPKSMTDLCPEIKGQ